MQNNNNFVILLGEIKSTYVIGDYAKGMGFGIIDLFLIDKMDQKMLQQLIGKTETLINHKIILMVLTEVEFKKLNKTLDISHIFPI